MVTLGDGASMIKHKLSNVVLKIADHMKDYPEVYYRVDSIAGGSAAFNESNQSLEISGKVDFLTYFNSCSIAKWKKYANIQKAKLHLELAGDACTVQFVGISYKDKNASVLSEGQRLVGGVEENGRLVFEIDAPETSKGILGFVLQVRGKAKLFDAYYFAEVEEEIINPVKLALSTTTFKKEQYIVPNIELVKREVLASKDPVANAFHMFVVDNGCTLDAAALSDDGVTVLPNKKCWWCGWFRSWHDGSIVER